MKKAFISAMSLLLIMLSAFTVCANSETYFVNELNFSINLPSYYSVLTRDIEEDSPALKSFGYTKDELLSIMEERNIYFNAISSKNSVREDIVITSTKITVSDICIFDDEELEKMVEVSIKNNEAQGADVLECNVYTNTKTTYIVTTLNDPAAGNAINYYTINNYDAINITCWTYRNDMTDSKKDFFKSIIDGITFEAYASDSGKKPIAIPENPNMNIITEPAEETKPMAYLTTNLTYFSGIYVLGFYLLILIGGGIAAIIIVTNVKKRRRLTIANTNQAFVYDKKFCIYCGTQIKSTDSFCYKCGHSQNSAPDNSSDIDNGI